MAKRQKQKSSSRKQTVQAPGPLEGMSAGWTAVLLAVITAAMLMPFAGKAFHIDDPLFIWAGKQIQKEPLDPYGFMVNWYGTPMPMYEVTKNPPLACYYIALAALAFGWSEVALHLAFLPWAVAAVLGTWLLARRFCGRPVAAALAALATPVFLVSGTTVMCDVMMLALWVFAVYLWIRGLEDNRKWCLPASAVLMALVPLTKFFGVSVIPLLFAYSAFRRRSVGWWALYFAVPVLALLGFNAATHQLYGLGMLGDAGAYALGVEKRTVLLAGGLTTLSFLGGGIAVLLFFAPWLWSRKAILAGALALAALMAVLPLTEAFAKFQMPKEGFDFFLFLFQFALWAVVGGGLLWMSAEDLARNRDAASLLLALWVWGTFVFTWIFNWSVNGRSVLPAVSAAAILMMRRIEWRKAAPGGTGIAGFMRPLLPSAILALAVTIADVHLAGSARTAANQVHDRFGRGAGAIWFQGHWGFQYYMESQGARALDISRATVSSGDFLAIPYNNTNIFAISREQMIHRLMIEQKPNRLLGTMNPKAGAGFYSDVWGPLPFAAGNMAPEQVEVLQVR